MGEPKDSATVISSSEEASVNDFKRDAKVCSTYHLEAERQIPSLRLCRAECGVRRGSSSGFFQVVTRVAVLLSNQVRRD